MYHVMFKATVNKRVVCVFELRKSNKFESAEDFCQSAEIDIQQYPFVTNKLLLAIMRACEVNFVEHATYSVVVKEL